jgi:hypothetical protein
MSNPAPCHKFICFSVCCIRPHLCLLCFISIPTLQRCVFLTGFEFFKFLHPHDLFISLCNYTPRLPIISLLFIFHPHIYILTSTFITLKDKSHRYNTLYFYFFFNFSKKCNNLSTLNIYSLLYCVVKKKVDIFFIQRNDEKIKCRCYMAQIYKKGK